MLYPPQLRTRVRKPATVVDEARSEIEDNADFHAVHVPAGFAFDLRPFTW